MCDMNVSIGSKFAYVIFNYCMAAVRRYRLLIYVRFDHTRRTTGVGTSEPVFSANRTSALIKQLPYRYTLATGRNQLKADGRSMYLARFVNYVESMQDRIFGEVNISQPAG